MCFLEVFMAYISGTDRFQIGLSDMFSFDSLIAEDNPIRAIDAFVNNLDLEKLGFVTYAGDKRGQKPYKTSDLLKIHLYCFYNGIQSSRKQERECARNIELIWLTGNLKPDHSTIANFFKENSDAIKKVFKEFSKLCKKLDLYSFKLFAVDGTKIKAYCSNKKAFTPKKLEELLINIDQKIKEYSAKLDDETLDQEQVASFNEKLKLINDRKDEYTELQERMEKENLKEICVTDPDSKVMKNHRNIEPCYNVQSVVDSKNKLILDYDVTNQANDVGLLKPMVDKTFKDYEVNDMLEENPEHELTITADTGYYKSEDMLELNNKQVHVLVPKSKKVNPNGEQDFSKDNFEYNKERDVYICPAKKELTFARKSTETRNGNSITYKIYVCNSCAKCPHNTKCTKAVNGRSIKRHPKEDKLDAFEAEYKKDNSLYKMRKELVEHPFGTIKRAMGLTHVYVKGKDRVSSWTASTFLAYNFKRVINIVGVKELIAKLDALMAA